MQKLIIIFTLCFSVLFSKAQEKVISPVTKKLFRGMVVAGFNASQVDGDRMGGYNKFGAQVGGGVLINLPLSLSVGVELLYSMKGSRVSPAQVKENPFWAGRKIQLDYIDIPLTLNYTIKKHIMVGAGLSGTVLVRQKTDAGTSIASDLRRIGLEGTLGASYIFADKLGVGLRWSYSLIPLDHDLYATNSTYFDTHLRNNVLSGRVFYLF
jgi:opacity protein-like surface antigen